MTSSYPHLTLQRETPITEKRPGQPPRSKKLDNPSAHAESLQLQLQKTIQQTGQAEKDLRSEALNRFITEQAEAARDAIGNMLVLAGGLIFAALCLFSVAMGWK